MSLKIRLQHNFREKLLALPDIVFEATREVIRERAQLMTGIAKVKVPVDTGSLRDSIRMQWIGRGRRICTVRAGGYVTNPTTGKLVDYAAHVELKTPFMWPAWLEVKEGVVAAIQYMISQKVKE